MITEFFTSGYKVGLLNFISLIAILCGISVIISKNPIISVLFLIGLFLSISLYLILLGLGFIGVSYLLVYIGAVSILFLFILMLINIRISELLSDTSNSIPLAIIVGICFNHTVYQILPYDIAAFNTNESHYNNTIKDIFYNNNYSDILKKYINFFEDNGVIAFATSKSWDGFLAETSHITTIGNIMYSSYSIWLIITSIILLLAMVGTICLVIKQNA